MSVRNPTVGFADYKDKYQNIAFARTNGVLEMTLHTDGGPFVMSGLAHAEIGDAFHNLGADHENKVVIVTGTGDVFL